MDDPIHFSQLLLGHVGKRESRDLMSCVLADRDATLRWGGEREFIKHSQVLGKVKGPRPGMDREVCPEYNQSLGLTYPG